MNADNNPLASKIEKFKKSHTKPSKQEDDDDAVESKAVAKKYGEYVKINSVYEIVESITVPLLTAMKVREEEAIKATNQLN